MKTSSPSFSANIQNTYLWTPEVYLGAATGAEGRTEGPFPNGEMAAIFLSNFYDVVNTGSPTLEI